MMEEVSCLPLLHMMEKSKFSSQVNHIFSRKTALPTTTGQAVPKWSQGATLGPLLIYFLSKCLIVGDMNSNVLSSLLQLETYSRAAPSTVPAIQSIEQTPTEQKGQRNLFCFRVLRGKHTGPQSHSPGNNPSRMNMSLLGQVRKEYFRQRGQQVQKPIWRRESSE